MANSKSNSPELPIGWTRVVLEDYMDLAGRIGWRGLKKKEYLKRGALLVAIKDISEDGAINYDGITDHLSKFRYDESPEIQLENQDILITKDGTIGKIGFVENLPQEATVNSSILVARPCSAILPRFLFHYFRSDKFQEIVQERITGSTVPHLFQHDIKKFQLEIPPLAEQHRIVSKIESVVREIRTARRSLEKLPSLIKIFRQSILAKAFTGALAHRDSNEEPARDLLERVRRERRKEWQEDLIAEGKDPRRRKYKEPEPLNIKDLPEIPQNWVWTSLSEVCTKIQDGTHFSPQNSANLIDGVPYITAKNIRSHGIDLSNLTYVSKSAHEEISRRCNPEKGDVIYIKDGATTGLAVVNELDFPFSMLSSLALLKPDKRLLNNRFLVYYLNSPEAFRRMTGKMTGTAIKRIILRRIRRAEFPLAPPNEQGRIVNKIDEMFSFAVETEDAVIRASKQVETVGRAILARAFRGELVPQDPDDEPASILLERIKGKRFKTSKSSKGQKRRRIRTTPRKTLLDYTDS